MQGRVSLVLALQIFSLVFRIIAITLYKQEKFPKIFIHPLIPYQCLLSNAPTAVVSWWSCANLFPTIQQDIRCVHRAMAVSIVINYPQNNAYLSEWDHLSLILVRTLWLASMRYLLAGMGTVKKSSAAITASPNISQACCSRILTLSSPSYRNNTHIKTNNINTEAISKYLTSLLQ